MNICQRKNGTVDNFETTNLVYRSVRKEEKRSSEYAQQRKEPKGSAQVEGERQGDYETLHAKRKEHCRAGTTD